VVDVAHVVVLMLENRSFDHLLGYVQHPDPAAFDGLLGAGPFTNPDSAGGTVAASPSAKQVLPAGPGHSHDAVMGQLTLTAGKPTNQGFVRSYERKCRGLDPVRWGGLLGPLVNWLHGLSSPGHAVTGRGPLAMACQSPEHVPVLARLACEFAVCTRWFCPVPGETWPNRNFAHAATSDGDTDNEIRPYTNPTIFELLEKHGADWRIYFDDTPQAWAFPALWDTAERHAKWFPLDRFTEHAARGDLPAYAFIEPNHRPPLHTPDHDPVIGSPGLSNNQHPENNLVSNAAYDTYPPDSESDFTRAEQLIAAIYEALRANPELFDQTLLLVTYDEHGGLYDHVPPPTGVPGPGGGTSGVGVVQRALLYRKAAAFDFTVLGPRVPAVVISPRVRAGTIDAQPRDHASIPATLRSLFAPGAQPLTARDRWSPPFHHLLTLPEPRTDLPDLSAHATRIVAAVSEPPATQAPAAETAPAAGAASATKAAPAGEATAPATQAAPAPAAGPPGVPAFYQPFMALADGVQRHLVAVGEPEAIAAPPTGPPIDRSAQISQTFAAAAHRHRHPDEAAPSS
jgi:phospholipase C